MEEDALKERGCRIAACRHSVPCGGGAGVRAFSKQKGFWVQNLQVCHTEIEAKLEGLWEKLYYIWQPWLQSSKVILFCLLAAFGLSLLPVL